MWDVSYVLSVCDGQVRPTRSVPWVAARDLQQFLAARTVAVAHAVDHRPGPGAIIVAAAACPDVDRHPLARRPGPDADVRIVKQLCIVARLASAADGEVWHQRYFGTIDRDFQTALAQALPCASRDDVEAGFRYSRSLFGEVLLHRCGKTGGTCRPRGFREEDIDRLIRYLGGGMRGLAGIPSHVAGIGTA